MPFLNTPTIRRVKAEVAAILHLPLVERLTHHNARRPLMAILLGVVMMLVGSIIVSIKEELHHYFGGHHIVFDTFGLFLHGIGAVPLLRYVEPVWMLVMGAAETAGGEAAVTAGAAIAGGGVVALLDREEAPKPKPTKTKKVGTPFRTAKRRKHGKRK